MKKLFTLIAAAFVATLSGSAQLIKVDQTVTSFSIGYKDDNVTNVSIVDNEFVLVNEALVEPFWGYQYHLLNNLSLDTNKEYYVTLTGMASGSGNADIRWKVGDWDAQITYPQGHFIMPADGVYRDYTFKITPSVANNFILLQHGDFVGTIKWKKVKITHIDDTGLKKALVVKSGATNTYDYESQIFINLPSDLTPGNDNYKIKFKAKATAEFHFGSEGIDDKQEAHKNKWGNSAIFNYTADGDITTSYNTFEISLPGTTASDFNETCTTHSQVHKDFSYAPTALLLNIGKLPKDATLTISEVQFFDGTNYTDIPLNSVAEYDKSKSVYYPGWQHTIDAKIVYEKSDGSPAGIIVDGINEAYTLSSPFILDFTDVTATEAYIATDVSNGKVSMQKVTGAVPVNTGLVLKQVGDNSSVIIPIGETPTFNVSANKLVATTASTPVPQNEYVLAGAGDNLGWYKVGTTDKPTLAPGKAYLSLGGSSAKIGISWGDDNTTGVEAISTKANEADDAWYTVTGVKVNGVKKGLYIHNGKKVIVRQ